MNSLYTFELKKDQDGKYYYPKNKYIETIPAVSVGSSVAFMVVFSL